MMEEQVKEPISSWNMDGADNGDIMPIASGPVGQLFEVYACEGFGIEQAGGDVFRHGHAPYRVQWCGL